MIGRRQEEIVRRPRTLPISLRFSLEHRMKMMTKGDTQDHNHKEDGCFPPSVFEWQPNPVILPHLRGEHFQSLNLGPSVTKDTSYSYVVDTAREAERFCPDMVVDLRTKALPRMMRSLLMNPDTQVQQ
jgi:hypothetical protein